MSYHQCFRHKLEAWHPMRCSEEHWPHPSQTWCTPVCAGMLLAGHTWPPDKAGHSGHPGRPRAPTGDLPVPGGWCWVLEVAVQYTGSQELLYITTQQHAVQRGGRGRRSSSELYSVTSHGGRRFALCYSSYTHTFLAGRAEVQSNQLLPECKALHWGGWSLITGHELTPVEGRE